MTIEHEAARLQAYLQGEPYLNYVYSYPHKTTYRTLPEPLALKKAWAAEDKRSLFLYVHIPFCEMRCAYCNLFTTSQPPADWVDAYLQTLVRQMAVTAEDLGEFRFEQLAVGGGTPTYLSTSQLDNLFRSLERHLGAQRLPASVEVSPATVNADKLACLRTHGVERISIGIESFQADDLKALGRPQVLPQVQAALQCIRDSGIPRLNIDLIYGNAGQTPARWLASLEQALAWSPEELFIYPLYVRPLTGLGRKQQQAQDGIRLQLYQLGRERLLAAGYRQTSMRMFVRGADVAGQTPARYRCQEDGMVGLGAGARSYTQSWHYSSRYAVGKQQIKAMIQAYTASETEVFRSTDYGMFLDEREQRHRYLLLSLLQVDGLAWAMYAARFGGALLDDFPQLTALVEQGLAVMDVECIRLTEQGIAHSDLVGNWLFSELVRDRMGAWEWC